MVHMYVLILHDMHTLRSHIHCAPGAAEKGEGGQRGAIALSKRLWRDLDPLKLSIAVIESLAQ